MRTKSLSAVVATVLVAGGLVLVPPARTASAGTACTSTTITINAGTGAEPKSTSKGHTHVTGNHYVSSISGGYWYWYADNNGGVDGDSWDTYLGLKKCA